MITATVKFLVYIAPIAAYLTFACSFRNSIFPYLDNKFTPETKTIEIVEGDDLHIRCESQEEVTFYVNGVEKDDSRITIKKEHVSEGDYPFVATLIYRHLVPADASEIQCIRNPSGNVQVIKNWSYRVVGKAKRTRSNFKTKFVFVRS